MRRPTRIERGRYLEDFAPQTRLTHHWGRTITEGEAALFATWTMQFNPIYFNVVHARHQGHPACPVCPAMVLNVVFGLSVEDLSEQALAHLGYADVRFLAPVYPGDTLFSESTVLSVRPSDTKPDRGIVQVRTEGRNQHGEPVLSYERAILVKRRSHHAPSVPQESPVARP